MMPKQTLSYKILASISGVKEQKLFRDVVSEYNKRPSKHIEATFSIEWVKPDRSGAFIKRSKALLSRCDYMLTILPSSAEPSISAYFHNSLNPLLTDAMGFISDENYPIRDVAIFEPNQIKGQTKSFDFLSELRSFKRRYSGHPALKIGRYSNDNELRKEVLKNLELWTESLKAQQQSSRSFNNLLELRGSKGSSSFHPILKLEKLNNLDLWTGDLEKKKLSSEKDKSIELLSTDDNIDNENNSINHKVDIKPNDNSKNKETFYFALTGDEDQVRGFQVVYEANVDLIFSYGIPPSPSVVNIKGQELDKSRLSDDGELGIAVIPIGLLFRNNEKTDWYRIAKFSKGQILEKLRFEFCTIKLIDSNNKENYGFNIIIDVRGLVVYSFFLEVSLVDHLDPMLPDKFNEPISLDLDSVNQRVKKFESRISKEKQHA